MKYLYILLFTQLVFGQIEWSGSPDFTLTVSGTSYFVIEEDNPFPLNLRDQLDMGSFPAPINPDDINYGIWRPTPQDHFDSLDDYTLFTDFTQTRNGYIGADLVSTVTRTVSARITYITDTGSERPRTIRGNVLYRGADRDLNGDGDMIDVVEFTTASAWYSIPGSGSTTQFRWIDVGEPVVTVNLTNVNYLHNRADYATEIDREFAIRKHIESRVGNGHQGNYNARYISQTADLYNNRVPYDLVTDPRGNPVYHYDNLVISWPSGYQLFTHNDGTRKRVIVTLQIDCGTGTPCSVENTGRWTVQSPWTTPVVEEMYENEIGIDVNRDGDMIDEASREYITTGELELDYTTIEWHVINDRG